MVVISVYTYGVKIILKFRWESGFLCTNGSAGYLMQLSVKANVRYPLFLRTKHCENSFRWIDHLHKTHNAPWLEANILKFYFLICMVDNRDKVLIYYFKSRCIMGYVQMVYYHHPCDR